MQRAGKPWKCVFIRLRDTFRRVLDELLVLAYALQDALVVLLVDAARLVEVGPDAFLSCDRSKVWPDTLEVWIALVFWRSYRTGGGEHGECAEKEEDGGELHDDWM